MVPPPRYAKDARMPQPKTQFDAGISWPAKPKVIYLSWKALQKKTKSKKTIGLCRVENFTQKAEVFFGEYNQRGQKGGFVAWVRCKFKPQVNIYLAKEMKTDKRCLDYVMAHELEHFKDYKKYGEGFAKGLEKAVMKKARHAPEGLFKGTNKKNWQRTQNMEIEQIIDTFARAFFKQMMADSEGHLDTTRTYDTATGLCRTCLKLK